MNTDIVYQHHGMRLDIVLDTEYHDTVIWHKCLPLAHITKYWHVPLANQELSRLIV